LFVIISPC